MIKTTVLFCVLIVSKAARYGEKNDIALFLFIFLKEKQMFQDGVQEAIESNWDTGNILNFLKPQGVLYSRWRYALKSWLQSAIFHEKKKKIILIGKFCVALVSERFFQYFFFFP